MKRTAEEMFGALLRSQARMLGVPLAHAAGTGTFHSKLPNSSLSFAMVACLFSSLWRRAAQFRHLRVETGYYDETYIADDSGNVLECVPPGIEGVAVNTVSIPEVPPIPEEEQPAFGIPRFSYVLDGAINRMMSSEYMKKTRYFLVKNP
jgi:hypothetical protein